jgi:mannose-1-phosphate guanylyltransferase
MNNRYHAIIMAGGIGSRFWPLSRNQKPKQFLDILGTGQSLLQMTYQRLLQCIPKENIWIVSHKDYYDLIKSQLPDIHSDSILLEPSRRNTAPCLVYAAQRIYKKSPDSLLFIAPSDHLIVNEHLFINDVLSSFKFIAHNHQHLLTFGIQASRPDTGYGYIQYDSKNVITDEIYPVIRFVEKPDHNKAIEYLNLGNFVWNSGMFVWSCRTFLEEIKNFDSKLFQLFDRPDMDEVIDEIYAQSPSISIDYALLEKSNHVVTKTVDFGWSDLGTWGSLYTLKSHDANKNSTQGNHIVLSETTNCLIENKGKQLLAIQGLDNFIVVNTDDVLLICHKNSEQKIKELVKNLEVSDPKKFT